MRQVVPLIRTATVLPLQHRSATAHSTNQRVQCKATPVTCTRAAVPLTLLH